MQDKLSKSFAITFIKSTVVLLSIICIGLVVFLMIFLHCNFATTFVIWSITIIQILAGIMISSMPSRAIFWLLYLSGTWFVISIFLLSASLIVTAKVTNDGLFPISLLILGYTISFMLMYISYKKVWNDKIAGDLKSGRFDPKKGVYSPVVPTGEFQFRHKKDANKGIKLVGLSSILPFITAFVLVLTKKQIPIFSRESIICVLGYFLSIPASFGAVTQFYTYRWLKEWEDKNHRIVRIK